MARVLWATVTKKKGDAKREREQFSKAGKYILRMWTSVTKESNGRGERCTTVRRIVCACRQSGAGGHVYRALNGCVYRTNLLLRLKPSALARHTSSYGRPQLVVCRNCVNIDIETENGETTDTEIGQEDGSDTKSHEIKNGVPNDKEVGAQDNGRDESY